MFIFSNVIHNFVLEEGMVQKHLECDKIFKNNFKNFSIVETIHDAFSKVSHNMFFTYLL